jgi:serine/threonine protein kinase
MVATAVAHVMYELTETGNTTKTKPLNHCDIKLDNLMICQDKTDANAMTARVIDFGEATHRCSTGTALFVPHQPSAVSTVVDEIHSRFDTDISEWIPKVDLSNHIKNTKLLDGLHIRTGVWSVNSSYPDKYGLALTLAIIHGGKLDLSISATDPRTNLCLRLVNDDISWKSAIELIATFPQIATFTVRHSRYDIHGTTFPQSGGASRKAKPKPIHPPKWVSTRRKVEVRKRGSPIALKTVFRNSVNQELRIRKAILSKDGTRRFAYVKF